jgi:NADH-quinone oxidoreductase subunit H
MALAAALKVTTIFTVVMSIVGIMTWIERRGSAFIQRRQGPNRVGPFGLFQPLADGLKFFFKEDIVPTFVHKPIYVLAPTVSMCAALLTMAVVPFGSNVHIAGREIPMIIADVDAGVLFLLAASGMGVYGIIMAGWSSNNKYSLLGGLRSSAQMISYELALGLGVVSVLILSGSMRLTDVVAMQAEHFWNVLYMPVGFVLLLIAGFAETNRLPFDLPEAESELVGGYHTEYSSMKFSMFFMAEYANMFIGACLLVTLYLGGYAVPDFIQKPLGLEGNLLAAAQFVTFLAKVAFFMWLFVWVRWSLPRFRFDQLMNIGWKVLIPVGFINAIVAGLMTVLKPEWFS